MGTEHESDHAELPTRSLEDARENCAEKTREKNAEHAPNESVALANMLLKEQREEAAHQKSDHRPPGPATRALGRPQIVGLDGEVMVKGASPAHAPDAPPSQDAAQFADKTAALPERDAPFVHEKLTELGKTIRGPNRDLLERELRETFSRMNLKQVEELEKSFKEQGHGGLFPNLLANRDLSKETKEALVIYLKGSDKRTDDDVLKLADLALQRRDLMMFDQVFNRAPDSPDTWAGARRRFMEAGGEQKIRDAFGDKKTRKDEDGREVTSYEENAQVRHARKIVTIY